MDDTTRFSDRLAQAPTALTIAITLLVIVLGTRFLTGRPEENANDTKTVPMPGYWLPYIGHVPSLAFNAGRFLARLRDKYPQGIFSLYLKGSLHTFIYKPQLVTDLIEDKKTGVEEDWMADHLMVSAFGLSRSDLSTFRPVLKEIRARDRSSFTGKSLDELVKKTVSHLKTTAADLVTFNSSPADQSDWERLAEADVVEASSGDTFVEVDLMGLVEAFTAQTVNSTILGTNFSANFPDFSQIMGYFDSAIVAFAAHTPIWVPWFPLQRARGARRRALAYLYELSESMEKDLAGEDPGVKWQDVDHVSAMVKERAKTYSQKKMPMRVRTASDLSIAWETTTAFGPLVFWMLFEINRDPVLREQIREEISPYVKGVQPENEFGMGVWIAPSIQSLDVKGLLHDCPLLMSAYVETVRLYMCTGSSWHIQKDTRLGDGDGAYLLKKGTYAHAMWEMANLDPKRFSAPHEWQGARHIREIIGKEGKTVRAVDQEALSPYYGADQGMYNTTEFTMRGVLAHTAVLLTMYEIQAPEGKKWDPVSRTSRRAVMRYPANKVQVWIKRRQLPVEGRTRN